MIVGRGINLMSMKNYINYNNLKKIVKIINFTKNPFHLIKKSNLFVLTSTYEGLPNVLLETLVFKKIYNFYKVSNWSLRNFIKWKGWTTISG